MKHHSILRPSRKFLRSALLFTDHVVDFFFDGAACDVLVHHHPLQLADAAGPVRGLLFDGLIAPALDVVSMAGTAIKSAAGAIQQSAA
jgi:hypothetical protein